MCVCVCVCSFISECVFICIRAIKYNYTVLLSLRIHSTCSIRYQQT